MPASRTRSRSTLLLAVLVALAFLAVPDRARASGPDARWAEELGLRLDWNRLQFHDASALSAFVDAWQHAKPRGLRVVHFGDSHVQGGSTTQVLRAGLQQDFGNGGPGLIFPYTVAKARCPAEYESESKGKWECGSCRLLPPKVPVGVMGIACRTRQPGASFTITFRDPPPRGRHSLRIFCTRQPHRMRLEVRTNGRRYPVIVNPARPDSPPYVMVQLPTVGPEIQVRYLGRRGDGNTFEFRGMSLERKSDPGVRVHNAGLGATRFRAILHEDFLEPELGALRPDLVLLDYGTNDYLYDDAIRPELESTIRQVIRRIRAAVPGVSIVLTSAQDLYWKGTNRYSGHLFSDLVARLAREEGCAFWDWFWIAGGPATLMSWQERGLAQSDLVHLTRAGYDLKGRLLLDAVRRTVEWMQAHPGAGSLAFDRSGLPRPEPPPPPEPEPIEPVPVDMP